jgi:hypothetical protein
MKSKCLMALSALLGCTSASLPQTGHAATVDVSGNVAMLETWSNGNIAFTLSTTVSSCNGQFILNVSSAGAKNQYATLLAAKAKGGRVRVYGTDACITAEGGGGNYIPVSYVYLLDD